MRVRLSHVAVGLLLGATAFAQPPAVDRDTATVTIGDKKVSVEYGRPSFKGALKEGTFDDLLAKLPADRMWRAGANQVTTLTTEVGLTIGETKVPAGQYSLYVHCPGGGEFSLAINSVLGQPLGNVWKEAPADQKDQPWPHFKYTEEIGDKEVARASMKMLAAATDPPDLFTVTLQPAEGGATLTMTWGDQNWSIPLIAHE
jgi:hypothetical protein